MREYTTRPDHFRLVATPFYEETSPLETITDRELGIRVSEMLDMPEDFDEIIWLFKWSQRKGKK